MSWSSVGSWESSLLNNNVSDVTQADVLTDEAMFQSLILIMLSRVFFLHSLTFSWTLAKVGRMGNIWDNVRKQLNKIYNKGISYTVIIHVV